MPPTETLENQARDTARQGRQILTGQTSPSPLVDVADIDVDEGELVAPPAVNAGQDVANDIRQTATTQAQAGLSQAERQQLDRSEQVQEGEQERNRLLGALGRAFGTQSQIGETQIELEEDANIPQFSEDVVEIQNKIIQKERDFSNRLRRIEEEQTLSGAQKNARIAAVEREQARELADLAIIEQVKLNRLSNAQAMVDRKIKLLTADNQAKIDALKFFAQENQQNLTQEQNRQFSRLLKKEERAFEREKQRLELFESFKFNFLSNAAEDLQPPEYLQSIQQASGFSDLLSIDGIGKYTTSKIDRLNASLLGTKLSNELTKAEALKNAKDSGALTEQQAKTADDLRSEYNRLAEVKSAKSIESDTTSLLISLSEETGSADISAINSFQRLVVDPGVAVREGDVALLQSAQSFLETLETKKNELAKGELLPPNQRQDMRDLALKVYEARQAIVKKQTRPIRNRAQDSGIDFERYIGTEFATVEEIKRRTQNIKNLSDEEFANSVQNAFSTQSTNSDFYDSF